MARLMSGGWHQRHVGGSSFRRFKVFGGTEFSQTEPFLDRLKTNSWPQNTWRRVECAEYLRVWSFIGHSKVVKTWQTWLVLNHRGQNLQEKFISRKTRKIRKWIKARREWREWRMENSLDEFFSAGREWAAEKEAGQTWGRHTWAPGVPTQSFPRFSLCIALACFSEVSFIPKLLFVIICTFGSAFCLFTLTDFIHFSVHWNSFCSGCCPGYSSHRDGQGCICIHWERDFQTMDQRTTKGLLKGLERTRIEIE